MSAFNFEIVPLLTSTFSFSIRYSFPLTSHRVHRVHGVDFLLPNWLLDIGYWLLVIGYSIHFLLLTSLSIFKYLAQSSQSTRRWLFTSKLVIGYWLLAIQFTSYF